MELFVNDKLEPGCGIVFGAADEKNRYALIREPHKSFYLYKLNKGKFERIDFIRTRFGFDDKINIVIKLESWRWFFYFNGNLEYSCLPKSLPASKFGFYCSKGASFKAACLRVIESSVHRFTGDISFSQEEFNKALDRIGCQAKSDFVLFDGGVKSTSSGFIHYHVKDLSFPDAKTLELTSYPKSSMSHGRTMIVGFRAGQPQNREMAMEQFEVLYSYMKNYSSSCISVNAVDADEEPTGAMKKRKSWIGRIKSDVYNKATPYVVELAFLEIDQGTYQSAFYFLCSSSRSY